MRFRQRSALDDLLTLTKTDALVQKSRDLNIWRRSDERAPHKPLLALYAFQFGGPDTTDTGLACCSIHQHAFDRERRLTGSPAILDRTPAATLPSAPCESRGAASDTGNGSDL